MKSDQYKIPIYSNGIERNGLYGYTNQAKADAGTVTVSARGTIGFAKLREEPFYPIVRLLVLIPRLDVILPKYLEIAVSLTEISRFGKSTPQLTVPQVSEVEIPLPPLDIQQAIVDEFKRVENEAQALGEQVSQIKAQRMALAEECYRKVGSLDKLRKVAHYATDRIDTSTLTRDTYVGVDNLLADVGGKRPSDYVPSSGTAIAYHPKDILLSNIRPYLKKAWLADNDGGSSGDVLVLQVDRAIALPEYVFLHTSSDRFFEYEMQNIGSNVKMPRADKKKVLDYQIPIPSLEEQRKIVVQILKYEEEIIRLKSRLSEIKAEKEAIVKKYL